MDFDDSPEEAAFRAEARAFLDERAPDVDGEVRHWPPRTLDDEGGEPFEAASRAWQATKREHGFAGITWPVEYGGRGLSGIFDGIFAEEQARAGALLSGLFMVAQGMVGPTIIEHGTDDQKRRFLDPILSGDHAWCQLFSEPNAGSDLAALQTRAVRDGDEWVVDGQKVWTSNGDKSDWGLLLARTDLDAPKHRGITCFLLDMSTPGIDVRPLRQATGAAEFSEVFLDGVRLPDGDRLGEAGNGWRVGLTTLLSERSSIGGASGWASPEQARDLADAFGRRDDPVIRQRIADLYMRTRIMTWLGYRSTTHLSRGEPLGPESSVMKLAMSRHLAETSDLLLELLGPVGTLDGDDAPDDAFWQGMFLYQWASRIGGGTDQVQRNVIAEHVLGLPREPRNDKDVPFRDLETA